MYIQRYLFNRLLMTAYIDLLIICSLFNNNNIQWNFYFEHQLYFEFEYKYYNNYIFIGLKQFLPIWKNKIELFSINPDI